jgi:DNA-binding FrmR family transcriptional regulator
VQAALRQVSRIVVEEHMETCLVEAAAHGEYDQALAELKAALKRLL